MEKSEIIKIVNDLLITKMEIDKEIINEEVTLIDDLGIDSLSLVDFILYLEKSFSVKIKLHELVDNVNNLNDLYDFIYKKQREKWAE